MEDKMEEKVDAPANWREYVSNTLKSLQFVSWIWREFVTPRGRKLTVWTSLALVAAAGIGMSWPYVIKWVIDGLVVRDTTMVIWSIALMAALEFTEHVVGYIEERVGEKLTAEQNSSLDTRMTELFLEKSVGQHRGESQELSPANVKEGRNAVQSLEKAVLYRLAPTLVRMVVLMGLLFWLHWAAGLAALAFMAYMAIWSLYLNRQVLTQGELIDKNLRACDRYADERWRNVERVKSFGKEAEECANIKQQVYQANVDAEKFWIWYQGRVLFRSLTSILPFFIGVVALGSALVLSGDWTIGTMMPFIMWTGNFIGCIWQFGEIERQINGNLPAIRTLHRLLTMEPTVQDAPDAIDLPVNGPIGLRFRSVSYTFPVKEEGDSQRPVLQNVDFSIEPGEKVAVIGASGAGKTTLTHLALRSMDPTQGSVEYDGVALTDLRLASVLEVLGYVPQGAPLFDGTIRELATYGLTKEERSEITDEEIWSVLRRYKADLGSRLTNGLDTKIGRDGLELSGGERQRLSAVMAFMKRRLRLLVMDEPTSSLDSSTEKAFQESLAVLLGEDVSALIIAHRLSTVRGCDKFVVLKSSDQLADGEEQVEAIAASFEELYQISPTFCQLADDQDMVIAPVGKKAYRVHPAQPIQA